MFPLIRFVAVFGGVAAGAQVASGLVRGVKQLCHGRPVTALVEVADGLAAPIMTAVGEVSKFSKEVYDALTCPWKGEPSEQPREEALTREERQGCRPEHAEKSGSLNGVAAVAAKS